MLCDTCGLQSRDRFFDDRQTSRKRSIRFQRNISRAFLFAFDQIKQILNDLTFDLIRSKNNGEST